MSMKLNHELPKPEILKQEIPMTEELKELKKKRDAEIRDVFTGKSDKFLEIGRASCRERVCKQV